MLTKKKMKKIIYHLVFRNNGVDEYEFSLGNDENDQQDPHEHLEMLRKNIKAFGLDKKVKFDKYLKHEFVKRK